MVSSCHIFFCISILPLIFSFGRKTIVKLIIFHIIVLFPGYERFFNCFIWVSKINILLWFSCCYWCFFSIVHHPSQKAMSKATFVHLEKKEETRSYFNNNLFAKQNWLIILFCKIINSQSYFKIVLLVYANIFYFCKSSTNIFLSSMKGVCVCVFVWALLSAQGALQSTHVFVCVFVSLGHRKIFYYFSFISHLWCWKCSNKC